ncbi:unnamed protein product [Darwinula stevensoni]|uniref:Polycomb protein VEFS-Box domain-containing protein n=1 Tax=Darwinula stevensoni TaxID=69355 RepID=A0A7R9A0B7_9CRUS|nr:unnamed protein product [Darwinula stevensoni]CAG0880719.1 unnamed protein product [Darwinula stevensoni]
MPSTKKFKDSGNSSQDASKPGTSNPKAAPSSSVNVQELFVQTFEKPTQIYRYLRTRILNSPIFLQRTLTYVVQSRKKSVSKRESRKKFKVDSILQTMLSKQEGQPEQASAYLSLTFLGLHFKVPLGKCSIPVNPNSDRPPATAPVLSVAPSSFSINNGHQIKSYNLLFRITTSSSAADDAEEPMHKRRRLRGSVPFSDENLSPAEPMLLVGELVIYDRSGRCLLFPGDYELVLSSILHASTTKGSPKKQRIWGTIDNTEVGEAFDALEKGPVLKFRLNWGNEPAKSEIEWPTPYQPLKCRENSSACASAKERRPAMMREGSRGSEEKERVIYQFICGQKTVVHTEMHEDTVCPWCSLSCKSLYTLLKHLNLCHARLNFAYVPLSQGTTRIDVTLNEAYDGSYSGNPTDMIAQPMTSAAFGKMGPERRAPMTTIMVCRPNRPHPSLSEFMQESEESESGPTPRPYITGHNRLYYHTTTCQPILARELDMDSEGENDPEWLRKKTQMMIDEFTDVNEGEKDLMKRWNLHVLKHNFVGDCQLPLACEMFVTSHGDGLLRDNLYRNFILHLCSMYDYGLIPPSVILKSAKQLQERLYKDPKLVKGFRANYQQQIDQWLQQGEDTEPHPQSESNNALPDPTAANAEVKQE